MYSCTKSYLISFYRHIIPSTFMSFHVFSSEQGPSRRPAPSVLWPSGFSIGVPFCDLRNPVQMIHMFIYVPQLVRLNPKHCNIIREKRTKHLESMMFLWISHSSPFRGFFCNMGNPQVTKTLNQTARKSRLVFGLGEMDSSSTNRGIWGVP